MTLKSLKRNIKRYKDIKAQFDEIEKIKNDLSGKIIEEFKAHELKSVDGLQLVTFTREYLTKTSGIPSDLWDLYKTDCQVEQLRKCKA